MKIAGKASVVTVAVVCAVVLGVVALLFLGSGQQPETVATEFMSDLARGDVKGLTDLSYVQGMSPDELAKKWDFAVHEAGKYYTFSYQILETSRQDSESAAIKMQVKRHLEHPGLYVDTYELPLVKTAQTGGKWKVDVRELDHDIFPAIPR